MMKSWIRLAGLGALTSVLMTGTAIAQTLPAVSAVNGKLELSGGGLNIPGVGSGIFTSANGSISIPLGERYGLQIDGMGAYALGGLTGGAAAHLFARDPSLGLIGATAGVIHRSGATLAAFGPEAELYFGRGSLEIWAGVAGAYYASMPNSTGFFGMADVAFYPTDDLRLAIGAASILGYESLSLSGEYQFQTSNHPMSLTASARLGEDGATEVRAGLKFYFGDDGKSLIDRHRQDDPRDRSLDLWNAAGTSGYNQAPSNPETPPCDPEFQNCPSS